MIIVRVLFLKSFVFHLVFVVLTANVLFAQNVGIGTNSPGSKLSVHGNMAVGTNYSNTLGPDNGLSIEGNVGIGTTSPAYKLDVRGTSHFTGLFTAISGMQAYGGEVSINANSNFNTNINTGTSTGAVNISTGTGATAITIGNLAAPATTTIYSGVTNTNAFVVTANSLTSGSGFYLSSNSIAGAGSKLLNLNRSGANTNASVTTYGLYSSVSNTGTSSTNIAAAFRASGASENIALRLEGATSGAIDITPPASTANYKLTLPAAQASTSGLALVNDGSGNLSWADATAGSSFSTSSQDNFEDFVFDDYAGNGSNDNQFAFTQAIAGSGSSSEVDGGAGLLYAGGNDYAGIHVLNTGTTATGRAAIGSFNHYNKIKVGGKQVIYEGRVRVENLSTSAQTFTVYFGLMDLTLAASTVTAGAPANGIYFTYTHGSNSGNWQAFSRSSSTSSTVNSSVAVVANTWYKLRAVVNDNGTNVDFYVDGTLIGSATTNIPTSAAMKFVYKLEKTVGTTARTSSLDYINWRMVR